MEGSSPEEQIKQKTGALTGSQWRLEVAPCTGELSQGEAWKLSLQFSPSSEAWRDRCHIPPLQAHEVTVGAAPSDTERPRRPQAGIQSHLRAGAAVHTLAQCGRWGR